MIKTVCDCLIFSRCEFFAVSRWPLAFLGAISICNLLFAEPAIELNRQRELFVDDYLVDKMDGVILELQTPVEREVAIVHDEPWEGNTSTYHTVFKDGDLYRMYYRGGHYDLKKNKATHPEFYCYAESKDGVHWTKPKLGLFEFDGSKDNNIILAGMGTHNLAPFRDANPAVTADARYKAMGGGKGGLIAFKSADGIRWSPMSDKPIITEGAFDSLNIAYWDTHRNCYVGFHRDFRDGVRDIKTCTSPDFLKWSRPEWLDYMGAPKQHLYTNAIVACPRAPHLFIGLPKRFVPGRNPTKHATDGVSDCLLMTSRDGVNFRRWNEAFIRPGSQPGRWVSRNNLAAWGIVTTKADVPDSPDELSIYITEAYYRGDGTRLRRYTLRLDGFVSVSASPEGGEMITKPLVFDAEHANLFVSFATSAAGSIRCEVQTVEREPVPGFTLSDAMDIYGDEIDRKVTWKSGSELSVLAGTPVRLRFVMNDADLYSLQFRGGSEK